MSMKDMAEGVIRIFQTVLPSGQTQTRITYDKCGCTSIHHGHPAGGCDSAAKFKVKGRGKLCIACNLKAH